MRTNRDFFLYLASTIVPYSIVVCSAWLLYCINALEHANYRQYELVDFFA
jgi:hypothetical protein